MCQKMVDKLKKLSWHQVFTPQSVAICLNKTFLCGQIFCWDRFEDKNFVYYVGVIDRDVFAFKQCKNDKLDPLKNPFCVTLLNQKTAFENQSNVAFKALDKKVNLFFHTEIPVEKCSSKWSASSAFFREPRFGLRVIKQDPFECTISFICSANNNIKRINSMLKSLRQEFGAPLLIEAGERYFSFPEARVLADIDEQDLRALNFGYRAKYVIAVAQYLANRDSFFDDLAAADYKSVILALTKLPGVGKKVADCIALFSLERFEAVPLDTHMIKVAKRIGLRNELKGSKTLTKRQYDELGDMFRDMFGKYAGWAQSYLFLDDLNNKSH